MADNVNPWQHHAWIWEPGTNDRAGVKHSGARDDLEERKGNSKRFDHVSKPR